MVVSRENIVNGFRDATATRKRQAGVLALSVFTLAVFGFTTDINWHLETLQMGLHNWDEALLNGLTGIYLGGPVSSILTVLYSGLTGVVLTVFGVQLARRNFEGKKLTSILPGFVATGCASCGVGLTGVLGLTGAVAAFPFQGDLFKLGGILLLLYALNEFGRSEICEISSA